MTRLTALALSQAILVCCLFADERSISGSPAGLSDPEIAVAIDRGCHWLIGQQSADGGWHSRTYGSMSGGAGNTALVLYAFAVAPSELAEPTDQAGTRGVNFLSSRLFPAQTTRSSENFVDYPIHAQALLLTALTRRPREVMDDLQDTLIRSLLDAQRTVANGWPEGHADCGGWGANHWRQREPPSPIPANVSVTALVLESLVGANALPDEASAEAHRFLERCQFHSSSADQGFYFTPRQDDPLNKAGWDSLPTGEPRAHPYHSATCDGLAALRYLANDHLRHHSHAVLDTLARLRRPEIPSASSRPQPGDPLAGLYYYDAAAFSTVWCLTHDCRLAGQRRAVQLELIQAQRPDGAWINDANSMREDDPLIATSFALIALQRLRTAGPQVASEDRTADNERVVADH